MCRISRAVVTFGCLIVASTVLIRQVSASAPDDAKREWAESLVEEVLSTRPQGAQTVASKALAAKAREGGAADRNAILGVAIAWMEDKSRPEPDRLQCCRLIGLIGDERGVPELTQVLLHDGSERMRVWAANALGELSNYPTARDALQQASGQEKSEMVRKALTRSLSRPAPASGVEELAPSGPPVPPPGPACPVSAPLPWPFPGDYKAQKIRYNYQYCAGDYIHIALDFMQPAGTPVAAVDSGYVAEIVSEPSHRYDGFTITTRQDGDRGWSYAHMDSRTFTFRQGDFVERGQVLGEIAEFAINGRRGDHLHLCYVSFARNASGRGNAHSLLDPLYCFEWKDTEAPTLAPLLFVPDGATEPLEADSQGVVTVSGRVDILAAIADVAYAGQSAVFGVPVVMLSISDGTHTMQKLVLDHRGDVGDWRQTTPLYLSLSDARRLFTIRGAGYWQALRVTKTDGDGKIAPQDATKCWDTMERDLAGKPLWPDGVYSVNVYAWDIAGNRGVAGAKVQVRNGPTSRPD
jgi:murein DD-endopeptidase MepM/ murein hydrolase activator NlpD